MDGVVLVCIVCLFLVQMVDGGGYGGVVFVFGDFF